MRAMAPETASALKSELAEFPFPQATEEDRAFNLLVREAYRITLDADCRSHLYPTI